MPDFRLFCILVLGFAPLIEAGEILSVEVERQEISAQPHAHEYLLASMNVYALSPYARYLRAPPPVEAAETVVFADSPLNLPDVRQAEYIAQAAREFALDPALIAAVIQTESAFRSRAVSPKGAQGLMQIMPETGRELGLVDPFDPAANIRAGSQYLKAQLTRFGTTEAALAAYNAGPGSVIRHGGVPPYPETRDFVQRVLGHWRRTRASGTIPARDGANIASF